MGAKTTVFQGIKNLVLTSLILGLFGILLRSTRIEKLPPLLSFPTYAPFQGEMKRRPGSSLLLSKKVAASQKVSLYQRFPRVQKITAPYRGDPSFISSTVFKLAGKDMGEISTFSFIDIFVHDIVYKYQKILTTIKVHAPSMDAPLSPQLKKIDAIINDLGNFEKLQTLLNFTHNKDFFHPLTPSSKDLIEKRFIALFTEVTKRTDALFSGHLKIAIASQKEFDTIK
ncbi:MAG: hypothetical protein OXB88_05110 [Bacteriovoracales bacterium]|nr:hypothetical protein [Bacteriovoracales bacterium]